MITCPRCGYQAPDGTPWCPRCGYGKPQTQNPQPAGQIPQPRQVPEIPQRPPDPLPERPEQKEKSSFGGNCLAIVLMAVFLILVVIMVVAIGRNKSNPKPTPTSTPTPTLDMTATSEAMESVVQEMLEQKMAETMNAIVPAEPTETEIPPATPTPKAKMPDYCGTDFQLELIRMAEVLDADGHPYQEEYMESNNMCIYRIVDNKSFLNMDSFGYLYLYFDENNQLYMTHLEIPYKDNDQTREIIRDWGAVALSTLDKDTNILIAQSAADNAISSGSAETANCEASGMLHTDKMIYRFIVRDKSIL